MTLTLRSRLLLNLAPLVVLAALLGGAGVVLLYRLSGRIDAILRENYDSVRAMQRFNESLERIDSAFQFALAGQEADARAAYIANAAALDEQFRIEQANLTVVPDEPILVERLGQLKDRYRSAGDRFFARPAGDAGRRDDYFAGGGLLEQFRDIKLAAADVLHLNQDNMEQASRDARRTARNSLVGFGVGLAAATLAGALAVWRLRRAILKPIDELTRATAAIGAGHLPRALPVLGNDELGRLAASFSAMTEQLRLYRQSSAGKLLRARRAGQAAIDSFPDPILVVDLEGRVELANPAARRLLGVTPSDAPWTPPLALKLPLDDALRGQRPSLTVSFDQAVFYHLDGEERAYLPQVRPIRDPDEGTLGAAVVLTDVTRYRLLDEAKTNLVATVSHEMKTPLTGLRLALHLLLEETVGPLEPKQVELLVDARDNAERLLKTIDHLLSLARMEDAGAAIDLRPVAPGEFLRAAAAEAEPRARNKHLRLTVDVPDDLPEIAADATRLGSALGNLIDNAIAHTEVGGEVTLAAAASDGVVRLTVTDTGVGIAPEYLPHVFDKFFRVPDPRHPASTGLGLAIVREVAQAHGGSVACDSTLGQGTTVTLTLPIRDASRKRGTEGHP